MVKQVHVHAELKCTLVRAIAIAIAYIVGSRGASQLGGSLLGIPLGYKANKLYLHEVN